MQAQLELRALRERAAQQPLEGRRDLLAALAGGQAHGEARLGALGHDRARLAGGDAVHVDRGAGHRAHVQLLGRAGVGGAGAGLRQQPVAGRQLLPGLELLGRRRLQAGAQRLRRAAGLGVGEHGGEQPVQDVDRVERRAAELARVGGPLARGHDEVRPDHAARADRQRRRVGVEHPAVEHDRRVGAALVGGHPALGRVGRRLLLALDQHAHVDAELARVGQLAGHEQQREEVALVVGGAAGVEAAVADVGLERRRGPARLVAGVLDVVVAVDQDRRRAVAVGAQLADDERRVIAVSGRARRCRRPPRSGAAPSRPPRRAPRGCRRPCETEGIRSQSPSSAIAASRSVTRAT